MSADRAVRWVVAGVGASFTLIGTWAFVSPTSFYARVATFPPENTHLIHDIGAFQVGLGAVLLAALVWSDAIRVALTGASVGSVLHFLGHVMDRDLGGRPVTDIPSLGLLALVLVLAAMWRAKAMGLPLDRAGSDEEPG